jgi:hypothetical protein
VTVGTVTEQLYDPVADLTENSEIDHGTSTSTLKACSISVDGTRIALGADDGRVKIYHLETGVWTLKKEYTIAAHQVMLNDAGTRLFVSNPTDNSNTGKVHVYDYTGGVWGSTETHSWVSPDGNANDYFGGQNGKGIDCNSDGTRLLVVTGYVGIKKAWIFDHNGTNWNTSATKTWTSSSAWWGTTCALNDTGDRAFIGYENGVDIFHYDGSNWPTSATKNYTGSGRFGASLTINGAGTRLLVGAYDYNSSNGQTTLYDYTGSVWNTLATQVINGSNGTDTYYGSGIHMSRDGKRYLVSTHNSSTYFSNGGYVELMEDTSGTGTFSLKQTFEPDAASEYMGSYQFQEGLCLDENGYSAVILSTGTDVSRFYSAPAPQPSLRSATSAGILAFHHGDFDDVYGDGTVSNAAANGHVYADTPTGTYSWGTLTVNMTTTSNTTYEWTPPGSGFTGDVLMVAGGGGGGDHVGGGGGAGGLLFYTGETMFGQKTVVVGNGGAGAVYGDNNPGSNGYDTSITGLTVAVGGGGGGNHPTGTPNSGGSGGGGGGGGTTTGAVAAPTGQGNNGGNGLTNNWAGGGGGGAFSAGSNASANTGGAGGAGKDLSTTFGSTYGDNGYFAGGGGGAGLNTLGSGGNGGGGNGSIENGASPTVGDTHTGGGGGGGGWQSGANGGSGIILIKYEPIVTTPSLTYDGYNKLTVDGQINQTLYKDSNSWSLGRASNVYIVESGEYIYFTRDAATAFLANVSVGSVSVGPGSYTTEPTFTSLNTVSTNESGWEVSASSNYDTNLVAWKAFNDGSGYWHSAEPDTGPHWLKIKLPYKRLITSYELKARDDSAQLIRAPESWVLQGSNDDSIWTDLETPHANDSSWTGGSNPPSRVFNVTTSIEYQYYRVYITDATNDNEAVAIGEFTLNIFVPPPQPPSLTYDGLNSLKVTGAEASSYITYKAYESNKFLACGTDLTTYPLSKTGNYKAEIAGSTTFTLTSNVLVPATNIVPLYQYPPTDGTTSGITETVTADVNSIWTISSAGYGNGLYHAQADVAATSTSVTAYHAFDSNLTAGFETTSSTTGTLRIQLPSAETIHKYVVWPKAADGNRPKSWTIEGSQDAATWYTIHTVTDSPPSLSGDVYEISSPAAYVYYRINVSANNGGTGLEIAELALYGDVAFSITFSDGWVTTTGDTNVTLGSSYTLPTYTSSLPVTVTGASDFDVNTTGTYVVVYTSVDINELVRRVVRRFVVA